MTDKPKRKYTKKIKNEESISTKEEIIPKKEEIIPKKEEIIPIKEEIIPKKEEIISNKKGRKKKSEDVPLDNDNLEESVNERKTKKKQTVESILKLLNETIELLDSEIEKRKKTLDKIKGLSTFRIVKKKLNYLQKNIPKIAKKTRTNNNTKNNFNKMVNISSDLANFIKIDKKIEIAREDIACAIFAYININPNEQREKILNFIKNYFICLFKKT